MKKIAVVLFVVAAALAGCHHKSSNTAKPAGGSGSAMGSDMGSGGGSAAGSGSDMGGGGGAM